MATQHQPEVLPIDVQDELFRLRNIIGMAAFAADARRVLNELHVLCGALPDLNTTLGRLLRHKNRWFSYPDNLADVLNDAHDRLGVLLDDEG